MPKLGYVLLLLTTLICVYTAAAAVVGHHKGSNRLVESAKQGVYAVFGLLTCASLILIYLFVVGDYSVKYVQHYSDRSMPLFYKATAMWGGQDGSLLFWVWVMSIWAAIAVYQNRGDRNRAIMPYTIVTMMWVTLFFMSLLITVTNPFETYMGAAPTDGRGLNPLLQNAYMVTHPPSLYLGYIGWTIPFCFAIGALAHGKLDYTWIDSMRRWCLVAWVCLSVGLALGGLWAYEELGWGGYWAWDPVENAAFMPWLTGTAFIHSIQVQERRGIFKIWNLLLIVITFVLTLLGTMMTRSGIVESVHAFAQSDIGDFFLSFLFVTLAISVALIFYRWKALEAKQGLESVVSREFAFLINNWVLLFAAFMVTFATLFPSLFKAVTSNEINVGPAFYNLWMIPVGLLLLSLTGIGPLLSWRKSTARTIFNQFVAPASVGIITFGAAILLSINVYGSSTFITPSYLPSGEGYAALTLGLCGFVTATIVQEFWRGTRIRAKNTNEALFAAFISLTSKAKRRYGGYIVHFGVMLMFVGFAGEAFKEEKQEIMAQGQKVKINNYDVQFDRLVYEDDGQKNAVTAHLSLFRAGTNEKLGTLTPAKWFYRKPEEQVTTEVDKYLSIAGDVYLVLGAYDAKANTASLQLKFNPLVNFVWLGCAFLMFGFAVAVWPNKTSAVEKYAPKRQWMRLSAGWASFLLSILALVLAVT
ncbi:MAG: heme lyase CcmF/NrfE family subunit [Myxococcota bacterium]|nr:heme lyase CcmF/NrfE family subunit [Myxococcota bacterium]